MKKFIYFLRLPLLFIIIACIATYLILLTNGYKFYKEAQKIEQTGMIFLRYDPKDASAELNKNTYINNSPAKFSELSSGRYDVVISKNGYQSWNKTFNVTSGLVEANEYVVLFLEKPIEMSITENEITAFKKLPNELNKSNIEIRNSSEIWITKTSQNDEDILVTRLSSDIKNIDYYSDKKHIIYQVNKTINVVDIDGSNSVTLVNLEDNNVYNFYVNDTGDFLYYGNDNMVKKVKIH